jgi:hypothetical protein
MLATGILSVGFHIAFIGSLLMDLVYVSPTPTGYSMFRVFFFFAELPKLTCWIPNYTHNNVFW